MKAIEAYPKCIGDILQDKEFVIPEFQRPYSWGVDECDQLWEDISSNIENGKYFLGSIVVYPDKKNEKVWSVIDGQQRLTTLFMLIKVFFAKASTMSILENKMYKTDPKTGQGIPGDLRLKSKVQSKDLENFEKIMAADISRMSTMSDKEIFKSNYKRLEKCVDSWFNKTPHAEAKEEFITSFLNNVVMLPIVCDSEDDALNLFQIINDRGMRLNDADIFKSELYKMCGNDSEKKDFIDRWNEIGKSENDQYHESLFRIYMHFLRSKTKDITKESALRPYIKKHLKELPSKEGWDSVMTILENIDKINTFNTCPGKLQCHTETISWTILEQYSNAYCLYPLYIFLLKHGQREDEKFFLAEDKQKEYVDLMEWTVRYSYVKGIVYNYVNSVKDTIFKVCGEITNNGYYIEEYKNNIGKDMKSFEQELEELDYGGKYTKGLVLINSWLYLNPNDSDYDEMLSNYAGVLSKKFNIEHILPKKWCNYDKWDEESHERDLNKIGNLIPLEKALNISASNEFFARKQKEYKKSKIRDALDLSKKDPGCWYPEDVEKRQEESLARLREFFGVIKQEQ